MSLSTNINRRVRWTVHMTLALALAAAGIAKLAGAEPMVQIFDLIGVGQWFRYVTGTAEVAGAILLLAPRTGFLGSLLLGSAMAVGAVISPLVIGASAVPGSVLAVLRGIDAERPRPVGGAYSVSAAAR